MRVPLRWLKDYVKLTLSVEELASRLTFAGLEVEKIEYVGLPAPSLVEGAHGSSRSSSAAVEAGLAWDREKIVVGAISEVMPHPNADRLVLVRLDDGEREHIVLTGAPNLFEHKGKGPLPKPLKVAYAKEGAMLYDGHQPGRVPTTLKRAKIRGVESYSMACSEKELGISDEYEGIILLDDDAPVGTPLADYLGDVVLDIAITPNQARNASIVGIAREVAALTGQKLRPPSFDVVAKGAEIKGQVEVEIREPDLNPRFSAALIKGVRIAPSPYWMQYRLRLAGMRPINNIVDVTNYVMLELGQPLHAFDYDKLVERAREAGGRGQGARPKIITRLPEPGERLTTLDGVDRALDPFTILVCDEKGALSIGGVMGGAESEVSETTTNVLLEAASWEYINIRRTLQAQRDAGNEIKSEAGYRFSRGVHPAMAERGLRRAIEMMRRIAGGEIAKGILDVYPRKPKKAVVEITAAEVERILGIRLSAAQIVKILRALEFECEVRQQEARSRGQGARSKRKSQSPISNLKSAIRVTVPDHRLDIGTGVVGQADLIEEIARIYGYDRLPGTQMSDTIPPQRGNPSLEREEQVRDILVNAGLQEVITYRLTTPEREAKIFPKGAAPDDRPYVTLANPIVADRVVMRHSLLASVLEVVAANARHRDRLALFEIGQVYLPVDASSLPDELRRLAIAMTGPRETRSWRGGDATPMDFYDLKGVIEALVDGLHLRGVSYALAGHPSYHPGRCAEIRRAATADSGQPIAVGHFGELHPLVREAYDLPARPVLVADLDLEALLAAVPAYYRTLPVPDFPPVLEDIAVIVDEAVTGEKVEAVIRAAGGELLAGVRLFDLYRGDQIGAGKKSLAYSLTYQAADRTLTEAEVRRVRERIVERLKKEIGARLRQ